MQKNIKPGLRLIVLLALLGGCFSVIAAAQDHQENHHADHMSMDSQEKEGSTETGMATATEMTYKDSETDHAGHMHDSHESPKPNTMGATEAGKPASVEMPLMDSEADHAAHMHDAHNSFQPHSMGTSETGKADSEETTGTDPKPVHAVHDHKAHETSQFEEIDLVVQEKLGALIPRDIRVIDEKGDSILLTELINKPTILAFIYYQCPMACNLIQGNLASAINDVPYNLGSQYQVLSISFDDDDRPKDAQKAKNDYFKILKEKPGDADWRFLTMDRHNAKMLGQAIGFPFKKTGPRLFIHPNLITVLGNEGKVIRYLYGTSFLPFNIGMAISEAKKGTPGISIKKILSYCFEYDPEKSGYTFKLFRIFGIVTLTLISVLLFFLLRKRPEK